MVGLATPCRAVRLLKRCIELWMSDTNMVEDQRSGVTRWARLVRKGVKILSLFAYNLINLGSGPAHQDEYPAMGMTDAK